MVNQMTRYLIILIGVCVIGTVQAQKKVTDSIIVLLAHEKKDSNRVTLLWNLANGYKAFNTDTARQLAQEALFLARKIKFTEGESRSSGVLANVFNQIGNYPKALEYYLLKLKLDEKSGKPQNLANVLLNIGTVYLYQEEYDKALNYYYQADSIMKVNTDGDVKFGAILRYSIATDIGDLYNRINMLDSSLLFFQRSLDIARQMGNGDFTGTSLVGLGEVSLKQRKFERSKTLFKNALMWLEDSKNESMICEASQGLANLYDSVKYDDSVKYYARKMWLLSKKDGFLNWQLSAAELLDAHFKKVKMIDSAYAYRVLSQQLRDSVSSREKVRQSQVISSDEQFRQREIADQKLKAKKERVQQLQLLFIGIFIPAFFLLTLLLSRRKIHARVIRFLGIISLLILFEYLTLLLHPYVAELTHHTPIFELLIFVVIAAFLIRAHHKIEQWFVDKLIHKKSRFGEVTISTKSIKIKMKMPSGDL